jgi:ABC-type oligopeptide transport system substrate-binding subunit
MDYTQLDDFLSELVSKKTAMSSMDYNDAAYDDLEESVHEMEDELIKKYGSALEEILSLVHDDFCSDTEVLNPIAYVGNKYVETPQGWTIGFNEGVPVEADDFEKENVRMVLVPKPLRVILNIGRKEQIEAWKAK